MKLSSTKHAALLLAIASLALGGCGKKDAEKNAKSETNGKTITEIAAEAPATVTAALPSPNMSKPLDSYPEINSGIQLMFLYEATSGMPVNYEKVAKQYSKEYRNESDSFKQRDLLTALKPRIDAEIAAVKANPYGVFEISRNPLATYDFDKKGFPVETFADEMYHYFNDAYEYKLGWANYRQLAFAPVSDEAAARQLESMRTDYSNQPSLRVFFFAQSVDLNDTKIKAYVTTVQIIDKRGQALLTYLPNQGINMVAPAQETRASTDAAADAATAAATDL